MRLIFPAEGDGLESRWRRKATRIVVPTGEHDLVIGASVRLPRFEPLDEASCGTMQSFSAHSLALGLQTEFTSRRNLSIPSLFLFTSPSPFQSYLPTLLSLLRSFLYLNTYISSFISSTTSIFQQILGLIRLDLRIFK